MSKPETHTLQAMDTKKKEKHPGGRPTIFNQSLADVILSEIASGETLSEVCRRPGMPSRQSVLRWRRKNQQFGADYLRAREDQTECWGDDIVAISDDNTFDTIESVDKQGNSIQVANHANVQRDRLRIDTRRFIMSTLNARYAPKQQHEHGGEVIHTVQLSDRERMRRLASFMLEDAKQSETRVVIDQAPSPAKQTAAQIVRGDSDQE